MAAEENEIFFNFLEKLLEFVPARISVRASPVKTGINIIQ